MMTFLLQYGISPLHAASIEGHIDVVKILIDAGADVNQANKVGNVNTFTVYTGI